MAKSLMTAQNLRHVNDYLTPLAALIVLPGLLVTALPLPAVIVGGALIACSVLVNYLSILLVKFDIRLVGKLRVGSNYVVNIFLLWLLYRSWPLVWSLLLLMSLGLAVYQTRRDSFLSGLALIAMLLAVHWSYGGHSLEDWAIVGVKASMIIVLNLFVNGLLEVECPRTAA